MLEEITYNQFCERKSRFRPFRRLGRRCRVIRHLCSPAVWFRAFNLLPQSKLVWKAEELPSRLRIASAVGKRGDREMDSEDTGDSSRNNGPQMDDGGADDIPDNQITLSRDTIYSLVRGFLLSRNGGSVLQCRTKEDVSSPLSCAGRGSIHCSLRAYTSLSY